MISPGTMLGGRYRLDERIASGGMGDVWRCVDDVLGRTVAVKILLPSLLEEPGFTERFRVEARTMATINHPGVVDIYDYGSDPKAGAYLVMEYVEGDALSRTLSRVGRLTPARTMALVAQAADALHAAHEIGVVHRDVKPGNLLVRPNGTLVLTDFGIARSAGAAQLTAAGSVLGTAAYISPEQAMGEQATPTVRHVRPGRRRLPVPGRPAPVRGRATRSRSRCGTCARCRRRCRRTSRRRSGRSSSGPWPRIRPPAGPPRPRSPPVARRAAAELAAAAPPRPGGPPPTAQVSGQPYRTNNPATPTPTPTPTGAPGVPVGVRTTASLPPGYPPGYHAAPQVPGYLQAPIPPKPRTSTGFVVAIISRWSWSRSAWARRWPSCNNSRARRPWGATGMCR